MAVYTEVSDEALDAFLSDYDIGEVLSYKGIAEGVENTNYLLHTTKDYFFLTLYEKRVKESDLPFFLGLLDHLASKEFPCPTPIHATDGTVIRRLSARPAAIVSFLDGVWLRKPQPKHCRALGEGLAQMHLAGAGYDKTRANALGLDDWSEVLESCGANANQVKDGLIDDLRTEHADLKKRWPSGLPTGVIHADLFPDNVFFIRDQLSGFIDFYFACVDYYAYDLAICLNAWCFENDAQFNITKARALMRGYNSVRKMNSEEVEALPLLARGAALRFLLTRLVDWLSPIEGALVKPKDPLEYYQKLRFHRQVTGPQDYGLN
jgi:homoserine kinase type II